MRKHKELVVGRYIATFGFTIVELLVVIVVIGILASITVVRYRGATSQATEASLKYDLSSAANQLEVYQSTYGSYPTAFDSLTNCPSAPKVDSNFCLKVSANNTYSLYLSDGDTYSLTETNSNGMAYVVTDSSTPRATTIDPDWITIGTQTWAKKNLNVGNMVTSAETNNGIAEKYCYDNVASNCDLYGGLYIWNEAMNYSTVEGSQGICPSGSHVPSDNDIKILEAYLGMPVLQLNLQGERGTDQGVKLRIGGGSGLNFPIGGFGSPSEGFIHNGSYSFVWTSSSDDSTSKWGRDLSDNYEGVSRGVSSITTGGTVRCLKD